MNARVLRRLIPLAVVLIVFAILIARHTSRHEAPPAQAGTAADSVAFAQVRAIKEEGPRFAALDQFVKEHPNVPQTGAAYAELIALAPKQAPDRVVPLLKDFMAKDFASSNPYNEIGWDLAEAGQHLDLALPILDRAVSKARAPGVDPKTLASCLDSQAWARLKSGDAKGAVAPEEESRKLFGPPMDDIEEHMATIYDAAGMPEKATPIYQALLGHMENPEIREKLTKAVGEAGGSMDQVNAQIDAARAAGATQAPDFELASIADGKPVSLSQFKGKVVLLNFWHYT